MLFLLLACVTPYPGACMAYQKLYCDTCELSDDEKTFCTCITKHKLTGDDFSGKKKPSDDDAQMQCDDWLNGINFPSPSQSAGCQQSLVLMREHKVDVCPGNSDTVFDTGF